MGSDLSHIYNQVKSTGLPNVMGARVPLPTNLNIPVWEYELRGIDEDSELLSMIKYGFPLGYAGPESGSIGIPNHRSASDYPHEVNRFINKEQNLGGIVGPMDLPPFSEWCHISPLMTREKKESDSRRVIIDMTYPAEKSVNGYIYKNTSLGIQRDHMLPSVDIVVAELARLGPGACMATTDISRAYKNFSSCPLDWPLLGFMWNSKYYTDITMPFGARSSSCHMQRVADAITRMLARRGIVCAIYLDDLITISPDIDAVRKDFAVMRQLLHELGLPESTQKIQEPASCVTWLGVCIDAKSMTLSLPIEKLNDVKLCVQKTIACRTISPKHLQSLLGKLLHVAKCVRPCRLFVSRLLDALRSMSRNFVKISGDMRLDLLWFQEFASTWNGVAMFPRSEYDRVITVDACGSGIGAFDDFKAYGGRITPISDPANNISELEAANLVAAVHTFVSERDRGKHIMVECDNLASVEVFRTGKARNKVILECARHLWMVQSLLDVKLSYRHIRGSDNMGADSLSRLHISQVYKRKAGEYLKKYNIEYIIPNLHIFNKLYPSLLSRKGTPVAPVKSCQEANSSQSGGH